MSDNHIRKMCHAKDTIINTNTDVTGDISFSNSLYISGLVKGNIESHTTEDKDSTLYISNNGYVKGNVNADNIIVEGQIDGNLCAYKSLTLLNTAVIKGDIYYKIISMDLGAKVDGCFSNEIEEIKKEKVKSSVSV